MGATTRYYLLPGDFFANWESVLADAGFRVEQIEVPATIDEHSCLCSVYDGDARTFFYHQMGKPLKVPVTDCELNAEVSFASGRRDLQVAFEFSQLLFLNGAEQVNLVCPGEKPFGCRHLYALNGLTVSEIRSQLESKPITIAWDAAADDDSAPRSLFGTSKGNRFQKVSIFVRDTGTGNSLIAIDYYGKRTPIMVVDEISRFVHERGGRECQLSVIEPPSKVT